MTAFSIGFYQLESLVLARPTFRFFDVRLSPVSVPVPRVQALLDNATVVIGTQLPAFVETHKIQKTEPIVLLCEDGRSSIALTSQLEEMGYDQLYYVEGGLDGLLRDASLSG